MSRRISADLGLVKELVGFLLVQTADIEGVRGRKAQGYDMTVGMSACSCILL